MNGGIRSVATYVGAHAAGCAVNDFPRVSAAKFGWLGPRDSPRDVGGEGGLACGRWAVR